MPFYKKENGSSFQKDHLFGMIGAVKPFQKDHLFGTMGDGSKPFQKDCLFGTVKETPPHPLSRKNPQKTAISAHPLGNNRHPPTPPLPLSEERASGALRFSLLKSAGRILASHGVKSSIRSCGASRPDMSADVPKGDFRPRMPVTIATNGERLRFSGLQNCGSARCPRCAPVRANQLSHRVGGVLDAVREQGFCVQFVTLTAHHTIKTRLHDMRAVLGDVYRRCWDGKAMSRLKREGLKGGVRVWEVTDGPKTGWHLHAHVLVISETAENCEESAQHLKGRWVDLLAKRGWKSSLAVQDSRPVTAGYEQLGEYGTLDMRGWGLAAEMAAGWVKTGRRPDRLSVPELLALAHAGDKWAAKRYAESVQALSGQRLFVVGPKLKAALGITSVTDLDEGSEMAEGEGADEWKVLGFIDGFVWGSFSPDMRPSVALLIWRHGVVKQETWITVRRRLDKLYRRSTAKITPRFCHQQESANAPS